MGAKESTETAILSSNRNPVHRPPSLAVLYWALATVLICYFFVENIDRLRQVAFVIVDDMEAGLAAAGWKQSGLSAYFTYAGHLARFSGRGYFYVTSVFYALPYLFSNHLLRALLIGTVQLLTFAALSLYVSRILKFEASILTMVLLYAFLPYWANHYPTSSFSIYFHLPVLFFFTSLLLFDYVQSRTDAKPRAALRILIAVLFFASICFYEALALIMAFLLTIRFAGQLFSAPPGARKSLYRSYAPFLGVFVLYAVVYVTAKMILPGGYHGTKITVSTLTNLPRILYVIAFFTVKGLPGANYIFQKFYLATEGSGSPYEIGLVRFAFDNAHLSNYYWGALVATCIAIYFLSPLRNPREQSPSRAGWLTMILSALTAGVLVNLPIAVTQHQGAFAYVYVSAYFTFLASIVALAVGICWLRLKMMNSTNLRRWSAAAALGLLLGTGSVFAQLANDFVIQGQAKYNVRWRLMDSWLKSSHFASLPENALLVSPNLIDPAIRELHDYWPTYIRLHSNRDVRVAASAPASGDRSYYLVQYADGASFEKALLVVTSIEGDGPGRGAGSQLFLLTNYDPKQVAVSYSVADCPGCQTGARSVTAAVGFRRENDFYVATLAAPNMVPGTASVARHEQSLLLTTGSYSGK